MSKRFLIETNLKLELLIYFILNLANFLWSGALN